MHAAMPTATAVASAVDVMADAVAVPEANAVIVLKADQKAEAMSAANAALSRAAQNLVVNNAMNNAANSVENNEVRAKSSASRVRRVNHVNPVKAVAQSAHAVNVASEANEAVSSAQRWTPPSKTLPWPTKPRWLRRWAVQL